MSRRLLGQLLVLSLLVNCAIGVIDVNQAEANGTKGFNLTNIEDGQEAPFPWDGGGEAPVGRTLLLLSLLKYKLSKLQQLDQVATTSTPFTGCICVPFYLCSANGTIITDGSGIFDYRQRRCTGDLEVCCYIRLPTQPPAVTTARPPSPVMPTIPITQPTGFPGMPTIPPTILPPTAPITQPTTRPPLTLPPITSSPITQPTTTPPRPTMATAFPYCICVPIYQCALAAPGGTGTTGIIDPRQQYINTCVGALVCCTYAAGSVKNADEGPQMRAMPVPLPSTSSFPPFVLPSGTAPTTTLATTTVLPPIISGQSCICMLLTACLQGWIPMSGVGNIDPRLIIGRQGQSPGTCSTSSMCCLVVQDNAGQSPFPAGSPLFPSAIPPTGVTYPPNFGNSNSNAIKNAGTANACVCVAVGQCAEANIVTYDNIGAIDPRFGPCASATLVCCRLQNRQRIENEVVGLPSPQAPPQGPPQAQIVSSSALTCGIRDTTYAATTQQTTGSTYFAEFPWMALLLVRKPGSNDIFQCGGSLINSRTVLTAAHCVVTCDPGTLIVRLGEWNTQSATEPLPYAEYTVQRIVVHPQFFSGPLYNDVALVVLQRQVTYAVNVRPVCLATTGQTFASGTTCYASGWGRNQFGTNGQYQTILRKVDLPIIDNANCQARLRLTRLGQAFVLHPSFICAGGVASKDTCYKDGGGPLVCQELGTGRFTQGGIISWGIGCGDNTPAVYASVAYARQWIDQQLALLGIINV